MTGTDFTRCAVCGEEMRRHRLNQGGRTMCPPRTISAQDGGAPGEGGLDPRSEGEASVGDPSAMTRAEFQPLPSRPAPSPYQEPPRGPELRWVPVLDIHLPLSPGVVSDIVLLAATDLMSKDRGPLIVRTESDDEDAMHVGYYTVIEP